MKTFYKNIIILFSLSFTFFSCEIDENEYDKLINEVDSNSTYYVQFKSKSELLSTSVDASGNLVDINKKIIVGLIGGPQSQNITVSIVVDPSSTADPSTYNLSSTSLTIPAGQLSGSINLTSNTKLMPLDQTRTLVLKINAGEHNATEATKITLSLYRINFCTLDINEFIGTGVGKDSWGYNTSVVTSLENGEFKITGLGVGFMTNFWEEVITEQTILNTVVNKVNGEFKIPYQYYMSTTYNGVPQPAYYIEGHGKMDACTGEFHVYFDFIQDGTSYTNWLQSYSWFHPFEEHIKIN